MISCGEGNSDFIWCVDSQQIISELLIEERTGTLFAQQLYSFRATHSKINQNQTGDQRRAIKTHAAMRQHLVAAFNQAGSEPRDDVNQALGVGQGPRHGGNVEVKYAGPDGVIVDVSETGWVGTSPLRSETRVG